MIRRILLSALILLVGFSFAAFAAGQAETPSTEDEQSSEELRRTPQDPRLHEPGKLTVATGDPVYPPWMLNDDPASGEGFENGLVYALAKEMGFDRDDVQWVTATFDQGIAPGNKPYDFVIQQYSVTEDREEFVDFSMVYYQPKKAVVALEDSPVADADSMADLRDAKWGATIGTTDLDYIENRIGAEDVAVFDDQVGTFQALLGGQIDATTQSVPTALYATAVQVPEAQIVATLPADPNDKGHGLVFEEGSPLVPWVNDALEAIIDDGVVEELRQQYLVGDESIKEIGG
ncbi:MAG: transporter substrate-binding domain-containing protein [Spirochaetes bacterium]|jgi:polar amino acid transport system substrate-binding protein|nr:transporter substrate-binding domain-containing protein [Spirochaetota bacterium]